jgi:UDP-N-acetylglucosamine 2-epimerase
MMVVHDGDTNTATVRALIAWNAQNGVTHEEDKALKSNLLIQG